MAVIKKSTITVEVGLDENRVPETMSWEASDSGMEKTDSPVMFMSVWDTEKKEALRIDLWTKEMMMHEMQMFFVQNFHTMADTYERSTSDEAGARRIRSFAKEFEEEIFKS
jgi:gliding motility-associated protein GldC